MEEILIFSAEREVEEAMLHRKEAGFRSRGGADLGVDVLDVIADCLLQRASAVRHARSRVLAIKRDAEAFNAALRRRRRTGELATMDAGEETLANFAEEWWRSGYQLGNLTPEVLGRAMSMPDTVTDPSVVVVREPRDVGWRRGRRPAPVPTGASWVHCRRSGDDERC